MGLIKIDVDETLIQRVQRLYSLPNASATVDFALRSMLPSTDQRDILELEGVGWEEDLSEIKGKPSPSEDSKD